MTVKIDLKKVEALASRGLTYEQIALSLGIDSSTLWRKRQKSQKLQDAIKRGKEKGIALIANKLFEEASSGNIAAMIFFLKAQGGWKERQVVEQKVSVDEKEAARRLSNEELMRIAGLDEGLEDGGGEGVAEKSVVAEAD